LYYNVFMTKAVKTYKRLEKALEIVGFDVQIPPRYKLVEINVINNEILELKFSRIIVRKAKYNKDNLNGKSIAEPYSEACPNDCFKGDFLSEGIRGIEYWNGSAQKPKAFLALFDDLDKTYSYSVYAPKGINLKIMSKWQKSFR